MPKYLWKPILPLSESDRQIDLAAMQQIYETWYNSKEYLQKASPTNLKAFNERLVRRLSIETGILERLYDLDRGTTEALVSEGFVVDFISHSSTDIEPSRLIDILRDQEAAIKLVMDCIAGSRPLTKSIIHELHLILTKHEDTTAAIDQLGNRRDIPLLKGKFKELPNNPRRPDGDTHEYCPPIHVASEIDNLLRWYAEYDDVDPIIKASWLHHRFTQIHPYQDGNGRVARALTTLTLLQSNLLPLVIDRDLRVEYIRALEAADANDMSPLAILFARLERTAIMQALSVDVDKEVSYQQTLTSAVIQNLKSKFGRRREVKHAELRTVNNLALVLRSNTRKIVEQAFAELKKPLSEVAEPEAFISEGGPDRGNSHWYKFEVGKSAVEAGKVANFTEAHYFVKATMRVQGERLVFVTSLHHVGRELSGIMEATAFARLEASDGDPEERDYALQDFFLCSLDPFVFTYKTTEKQISESFGRWLDAAIAIAFKEYGDRL